MPEREIEPKMAERDEIGIDDRTITAIFRFVNFFHGFCDVHFSLRLFLAGAVIPDFIIWLAAQNHCGIRPGCGSFPLYKN